MGMGTGIFKTVGGIAAVLLVFACGASIAEANTAGIIAPSDPNNPKADSGWQAGTCTVDTPTCSVATPAQFFEQAAGHPPVGFTQFIVKHRSTGRNPGRRTEDRPRRSPRRPQRQPRGDAAVPPGDLRSVSRSPVQPAPPSAKASSRPRCSASQPHCRKRRPSTTSSRPNGEPARFGLNLLGNKSTCRADLDWDGDYHEGFTIDVPATPFASLPLFENGVVLKNRLVFDGRSGDGTFITTPSTCLGPASAPAFEHVYSTWLLAASLGEEEEPGYEFPADAEPRFESTIPPGTSPKECESIPFEPSVAVDPNTAETDSPVRPAVEVDLPHQTKSKGGDQETLPPAHREGDAAGRDGPESLGRQRPRSLQRRPVRQGNEESGGLPGRLENRHRLDRDLAAAGRADHRQRLPRAAAQPRPGVGAASTASSSTSSRLVTASRCAWSATSAPTRRPGS